jgi:hypothetical protein
LPDAGINRFYRLGSVAQTWVGKMQNFEDSHVIAVTIKYQFIEYTLPQSCARRSL